jgi:hypothetical protein
VTSPLLHRWNLATRTCDICGGVAGKVAGACPGKPEQISTQAPMIFEDRPIAVHVTAAPAVVPHDLQPLIPNEAETPTAPVAQSAEEVRAAIEAAAAEASEVAVATAKVDFHFPAIGFIDPVVELEKMRKLSDAMPETERRGYPEQIRAKLLAHQANAKDNPAVTDEELALAIFIKRTTDSPLTPEDLETKATGKVKKKETTPKAAAKPKAKGIDDILGGLI